MLHPHHKLRYFKNARWENDWIESAKDIVCTQFHLLYRSLDTSWATSHKTPLTKVCILFPICYYLWITTSVGWQVILWAIEKYFWQPTCTSSAQTYRVAWWIGLVFGQWSWACHWCPSLVVWAQACLPLPSSDGTGLFIHPRCVLKS